MQEHEVCDDSGLRRLGRSCSDAVEDTCPHEATVGLCFRSPDVAGETDKSRCQQNRTSAKCSLQRNPEKVAETKH